MNKKLTIVFTLVFAMFLAGTVSAASKGSDPLQTLWDAVRALEQKIADIQLIPGPQGEQGIQGEPGKDGVDGKNLYLVDNADNKLGIFLGDDEVNHQYEFFIPEVGSLEHVDYRNNTFDVGTGPVFFDSLNCVGEAHSRVTKVVNDLTRVTGPRYFKHYKGETPIRKTALSWIPDNAQLCRNLSPSETADVYLLTEVFMPFPEPITWPVEIKQMQ